MLSLSSWKELLSFIPGLKPKPGAPGLCCISFDDSGIYSAYVIYSATQQPQLQWCEFTPHLTPNDLGQSLKALVKKHQLQNVNCSWLLPRGKYKLLTIESLPVKPEEQAAAARWHVKDLLDIPLDQTLLEVFPAPFALTFGKPNNLQVVATATAYLQTTVDIIKNSGLNLSIIDIPELALRNINTLFNEDKTGLGLLWLKPLRTKIIITKNVDLYVARGFDLALTETLASKDNEALTPAAQRQLEALAVEVQRSLDYYRSQLKQALPTKLLISALPPIALNYLAALLSPQSLELLNLSDLLATKEPITPELQLHCLAVMGGALRKENQHVAAN